jgi:two-component system response regulator AtoC
VIGPELLHLTPTDDFNSSVPATAPTLLPPRGVNLAQFEKDFVAQALDQANWNVTQAAKLLGISRDTLRYRIEKFQLARPS